jgi:hypothetical protein
MKNFMILLLLFVSYCGTSQPCSQIEKYGIFDTRTLNISRERAVSFLNFLKKDTKMTFEESKQYTAQVGYL